MKLIVLYGPPGVGKLTVARTLAKKTGYKVLHNHLLIELLCSLFDWGSAPYNKLVNRFRLQLLETAARYHIRGVIITLVYGAEAGIRDVRELIQKMEYLRAKVYFVKLTCSQKVLGQRIRHHSRREFTKVRRMKDVQKMMRKFDILSTIPVGNNLIIDSSSLSPTRAAEKIIKQYSL